MIHYCYIIDVIAMFGPSYSRLLPDYHQPSLHLRMISLASSEVHGDQRGKGFFPYPYPTSPFQRATHQQDLVPGCWSWAKVWRMWGYVLLPCFIDNRITGIDLKFESRTKLERIPSCSSLVWKIMSKSVVLDMHLPCNLLDKAGTGTNTWYTTLLTRNGHEHTAGNNAQILYGLEPFFVS